MRLIVPFALVMLLIAGILPDGTLYLVLTVAQLILYGVALTGAVLPAARGVRMVNLCYFFLVMNAAAVAGFWRWITGRSATSWRSASLRSPQI